jgi:lipopolysaccharide export system protein LptA
MKFRQYSILIFFFLGCLSLSLISYMGHFDDFGNDQSIPKNGPKSDTVDESYFKNVSYYSVDSNQPFLELNSDELSISSIDGVVIGFNPVGIVYRYEKDLTPQEPIHFQSKKSRALLKKKELFLDNEVEIKMGTTVLNAENVSILNKGEILYAYNDVKTLSSVETTGDQILITAKTAVYRPKDQVFEYRENINGKISRKRKYEESVEFKTDLLNLNAPQSHVEMKGNVSFKKENIDAQASRGEVFLENYNKRLKYYALYDDVRLQERLVHLGKPLLRKAFSEKLEGLISDKKIILTGLPKVFQEKDVIKGNRIIIRENVETVEVDDANTNITLEKDLRKE